MTALSLPSIHQRHNNVPVVHHINESCHLLYVYVTDIKLGCLIPCSAQPLLELSQNAPPSPPD